VNPRPAHAGATERLLTTRDVADLLGLSPEAVLRRWRAGELPGFRLSTKVLRFRESEVLAWLEGHREGPRPAVEPTVGLRVIASDEEEVAGDAG